MKLSLPFKLAALATAAIATITPYSRPVQAAAFGQKEVEQDRFIAVAAPFGENNYNLLVIEQIPGKQECWSTSGSNPVVVDPLLLDFDFTGICNRSVDSNGYSIRMDGEDLGLEYILRVVERDDELLLVGTPRIDRSQPEIVLGSTNGLADGYLKFQLEPGWRFAKRTFEGKTLGHVYLTQGEATFPDIANDIYKPEIQEAVAAGFISGFEDNTFRPQDTLTREQLVSMVVEALKSVPDANITVPTQVSSQPYPDVEPSRWSAAKIQWAKQNQIISGYPDGQFKPTQPVTRAELMAVLQQAAQYAKAQQGETAQLVATRTAQSFSDISNHWANSTINNMSAYCGVASPLNETGNTFAPDTPSQRNYAAAATLRMLNCVKADASEVQTQPTEAEEQPLEFQQPTETEEQPLEIQ